MGLSYTFNGHAIARAANDLSLHTDVVRSVLDAYLAEELRAAGVSEHTTSVTFSDRADALFAVPREPTVAELAERLAKVEHAFVQNVIDSQHYKMLNDRIDKVTEIIGARVSGLVDEIAAVRDSAKRAHERVEDIRDHVGLNGTADGWTFGDKVLRLVDFASAQGFRMGSNPTPPPAFPTGGASTAEAATDAVLPVPQRGDRVRLEGARSTMGRRVQDGWYAVVGSDINVFQIATRESNERDDLAAWLPWLHAENNPGLKEVRHADHA